MTKALINPSILTWALERAGMTVSEIAKKLHIQPDQFLLWQQGEKKPTFKQAQNFAHKTYIPFGYLYLNQPPKEEVLLPDLRTIGDHPIGQYSLALKDTIRSTLERHSWYQEYCQTNEHEPIHWLASETTSNLSGALKRARELLPSDRLSHPKNFMDYFILLRQHIEHLGVLVMRNSVVGNNTHRPLDPNEFRGFAISDKYAPVIFINAADSPQAQLFTLMGEFNS